MQVPRLALLALLALSIASCSSAVETQTSLLPPSSVPSVAGTPTLEPTSTETPTAVPPAPTATPVPPSETPTRTPTLVPARTPTRTPSPTARPSTATPTSKPTAQSGPVPAGVDNVMNADEQKMFALVNQERVKAGLSILTADLAFQSVARARAMDMARTAYYSHYDPRTGKLAALTMLQKLGVDVPMGENYYVNWPSDSSFAQRAMQWFMSDPPHHDNILSPRWTAGGVAVVATSDQKGIAIQEFGMK